MITWIQQCRKSGPPPLHKNHVQEKLKSSTCDTAPLNRGLLKFTRTITITRISSCVADITLCHFHFATVLRYRHQRISQVGNEILRSVNDELQLMLLVFAFA